MKGIKQPVLQQKPREVIPLSFSFYPKFFPACSIAAVGVGNRQGNWTAAPQSS